jgi:hypothetical protein
MDEGLATVIAAGITGFIAFLGYFLNRAEKRIKNVSDQLPSWTSLFEHNEQGTTLSGSIEKLIDAVEKGYPIKVKINEPNKGIFVMEAEWLIIENGVVYASNTNQISLTNNKGGDYIYQKQPYHYYVIVGSNGHHHATRIFINGAVRKPTDSRRHMAWIGLIPSDKS